MSITLLWLNPMQFSSSLIQFRKAQGLTQQSLADAAQIHVNQINGMKQAQHSLPWRPWSGWPKCCT